jgi:hypothetical protein
MFHRFQYESEYYPTLARVPLDVRRKLDVTGTTISLKDWLAFDLTERKVLCHLPVDDADERRAFVDYLNFLSHRYRDKPVENTPSISSQLWSPSKVPDPVMEQSAVCARAVTIEEWARWQPHERYALYKTATSTKQPEAFPQVLEQLRASNGSRRKIDAFKP